MELNFKEIKNNRTKRQLFRINLGDKDILIKLTDIWLPFDCQKYNNRYYLNAECIKSDQNLNKIKSFENAIINKFNKYEKYDKLEKKFISIIKERKDRIHLKCMIKVIKGNILINTDVDINNLKEHFPNKYDIVIKPEILWYDELNNNYGIIYYVNSIDVKLNKN